MKLLGISGSLRRESYNRKLVHEAARLFAPDDFIEGNLRLPLYDEDLEAQGIPAEVQTLADQITAADAVVISGPEYNKSISGVLKNTLDWVSRVEGNPWHNKPVAILSATAGMAGGPRAQFALRHCMVSFRPHLLMGPEVTIGNASDAFGEDGRLTNETSIKFLQELMDELRKAAKG